MRSKRVLCRWLRLCAKFAEGSRLQSVGERAKDLRTNRFMAGSKSQPTNPMKNLTSEELSRLNVCMAEKVMGWKRMTNNEYFAVDYYTADSMTDDWHNPDGTVAHHFDGQDDQCNDCSWNPCENPADAMAVLKKCAEKCASTVYDDSVDVSKTRSGWQVGKMMLGHEWEISPYVEAPTLELAICKFAEALFKD